ncbi:MAG: hypothetical protein QM635_01870 [Microbacteriaceae bacterium]
MTPRFRDLALPVDGDALDAGVEQDVERFAGLSVDGVVVGDDELVEERLVGESS